jgi:hypothetical protein
MKPPILCHVAPKLVQPDLKLSDASQMHLGLCKAPPSIPHPALGFHARGGSG